MGNKKGEIGENFIIGFELFLVITVAGVIFAFSAFVDNYYLNIANSEAKIINKQISDCLFRNQVFDVDMMQKYSNSVLVYCGYPQNERVFVRANLSVDGKDFSFYEGDSGALWIKDLFNVSNGEALNEISKSKPGYFSNSFNSMVYYQGKGYDSSVNVEVLIKNDNKNE